MPQMSPISWLVLFFFFSMIFIMFNVMNYFIYFPLITKSKNFKNKNNLSMNWKW
nr:ATP synthase F0 subunit 8 [Salpingogaster sp. ECU13]